MTQMMETRTTVGSRRPKANEADMTAMGEPDLMIWMVVTER